MSKAVKYVLPLAVAIFAAAAASSYGQAQLFSETWETNVTPIPITLVAPAAGNLTRDNLWVYNVPATGGTFAVRAVAAPLNSVALGNTVAGTANVNSTFDCANVTPWTVAKRETITLRAVFRPNTAAAAQGQRDLRLFFSDAAGNNWYGLIMNNQSDDGPQVDFQVQIRGNAANTNVSLAGAARPLITRAYTFTTTFTINAAGTATDYTYSIVDDLGVNYVASASGSAARVIADGISLSKAQVFSQRRCLSDIDNMRFNFTPAPPVPVLVALPSPLDISAQAATSQTGTLTLSNGGLSALTVDSVDVATTQQSAGAMFSLVNPFVGPQVIQPGNSILVPIQFANVLGTNDAPATGIVNIYSDNNAVPGTRDTVLLNGYRIDTFTWIEGGVAIWDTPTSWSPNGIPGREDTAIVTSGTINRSARNLTIDPLNATQNTALTSLSLTGGAINVTGNNFVVANTANSVVSFTQEGGAISAASFQTGNVGQGTYTMLSGQITASANFDVGVGGGIGTFNLDGGTIGCSAASRIGQGAFSRGTLDIKSGALTVTGNNVQVGNASPSTGVVTMSGGTVRNTGNNEINIGNAANAYGEWTQTGGDLTSGRDLAVGASGRGVMTLNNGTVTVTRNMLVANAAGSQGTLTLNGGSVDVVDLRLANANGSTATLAVASGATVDATGGLFVAYEVGSAASATISGGTVNVGTGNLVAGRAGSGTLNMSNGTVTITGDVRTASTGAGSLGAATFSGGTVTATGNLCPGYSGTGSCQISGSAAIQATNLIFGDNGGNGSFDMSGGSLDVARIRTDTGAISSWSWTGGTISCSTASLPIALTNAGGGGTLPIGGVGIGTTEFTQNTTYTQTAGAINFGIDNNGKADQMILTSATAQLNGGALNVALVSGGPSTGGRWVIVRATGSGSVEMGPIAVTIPVGAGWSITSDTTKVTVTYNTPPTANAGTNQTVEMGLGAVATANLNGSGSTDDGIPGPATYNWSKLSGPAGESFSPSNLVVSPQVTFTAIGAYVFQLILDDSQFTDSSTMSVTVNNDTPLVNAGVDIVTTRPTFLTVVLQGSASDNYPAGALTTTWTLESTPSGGDAGIVDANSPVTTVTLTDVVGTYIFRLTASDGIEVVSDDVLVNLIDVTNLPPIVDAGPDQAVSLGTGNQVVVQLAGTVTDPELKPTTSTWTVDSKPTGGNVAFYNADDRATTATISVKAGDYILKLTGSDGTYAVEDSTTITVSSRPASAVDVWTRY